jgi:muramidase (phage lysozyme)
MGSVGLAALIGLIPLLLTVPLLAQVLPTEETPSSLDKAIQELEREGSITVKKSQQLQRGESLMFPRLQFPGFPNAPRIFAITAERRALLNTIRYAEGTWKEGADLGYRVMFGGSLMDSLEKHPDNAAAGAYQLMPATWGLVVRTMGLAGFNPQVQDQVALFLIQNRGALAIADQGILSAELSKKLSGEWTSFPDSTGSNKSARTVKRLFELQSFYKANLARLVCPQASEHQEEADSFPNPSIKRTIALQRRNSALTDCNRYQMIQAKNKRTDWKTYGDVQIPWGLWFEPLAGKRVNGFLGSSNSLLTWGRSIESYGPTGAPNGISVSCSTGTFSINTNPNWNRVQSGWTEWAAPARNSNWERIVIDLCSPVVNR